MFDFHEKRKIRNIVYSKPILGLLIVVSVLLVYSVWGSYQKESETREKWKGRSAVLSELELRETELSTETERLKTERGIEAEIRSKFEVALEGEKVIIIVEPPEEEEIVVIPEKRNILLRIFGF